MLFGAIPFDVLGIDYESLFGPDGGKSREKVVWDWVDVSERVIEEFR